MAGNNGQGMNWIRKDKRLAVYLRDGGACVYCGRGPAVGAVLTLDHLKPRHAGGTNRASNLVTCCRSCNSAKQHRTVRAWYAALREAGRDTDRMGRRIRRLVAKPLAPYRAEARRLLESLEGDRLGEIIAIAG